jgi:hypothetical protein
MALKADRHEQTTDISFFYDAGTATRGGVVVLDAVGASGAAMDQGVNKVRYKQATATDVPVGILLNDVVDKDLTRTHLNFYKDEVQKGGKVTVMTEGYVVTNRISGTGTPVAGDAAYIADSGLISTSTRGLALDSGAGRIGRFLTAKDADGYAKVEINLP